MKTKDTMLSIRFNQTKLEKMHEIATKLGFKSFTEFVEAALDEKARRELPKPEETS